MSAAPCGSPGCAAHRERFGREPIGGGPVVAGALDEGAQPCGQSDLLVQFNEGGFDPLALDTILRGFSRVPFVDKVVERRFGVEQEQAQALRGVDLVALPRGDVLERCGHAAAEHEVSADGRGRERQNRDGPFPGRSMSGAILPSRWR